jgi:hypothetical protein
MRVSIFLIAFFLLAVSGCKSDSNNVTACSDGQLSASVDFHSLIRSLPDYVVGQLAKAPDMNGALGRNKDGYFHVRFQTDMGFLASSAIYFQNNQSLDYFIRAVEYSFARQKKAGDFELVVPPNLQPLGAPSNADLASGISFFTASLGSSLILLEQSPWFINRPKDPLTQRLDDLKNEFQLTLLYLKTQKEILKSYDTDAPNRLLFDALAFYSMGMYLSDSEAKTIGIEFIDLALARQDPKGFFAEGSGFDSSYNGVSLRLGFVLLGIIPSQEPISAQLRKSLNCGIQWQASRVLSTGEISLEGNTRVFVGGEAFLGEEKKVAWIETMLACYFAHSFSLDQTYLNMAKNIESFY